jgi:hypothetical protein
MSSWDNKVMPTGVGMNSYSPAVTANDLAYVNLEHVSPRRGRLEVPWGYKFFDSAVTDVQFPGILSLVKWTADNTLVSDLYAVDSTRIWHADFAVVPHQFGSPIYSSMVDDGLPVAWAEWYDTVYVSKRGSKLLRLDHSTATVVANNLSARYMIVSQGHLMLANYRDGPTDRPLGIKWSDLNLPESFDIATDSEADFYTLEPGHGEITGLSSHRGANLIYSRNSIWLSRYYPFPTGYRFEPLHSDVGCRFHFSQVSYKDKDYFIGPDNIYVMDAFQLTEIGDEIWTYFKTFNADINFDHYVRGYVDWNNDEVYWIFNHSEKAEKWAIVYNVKEKKWSNRNPAKISAALRFSVPVRGYTVIDDYSGVIIDSEVRAIDGLWQYVVTNEQEFYGTEEGHVVNPDLTRKTGPNGITINSEIETFDFFFDSIDERKELDRMTVGYVTTGGLNIKLSVGRRNHLDEAINWSLAFNMSDMLPNQRTFFFRNSGVGRYMRFKMTWTNAVNTYMDHISVISFKLKGEDRDVEAR